jgi:hypothetical protein
MVATTPRSDGDAPTVKPTVDIGPVNVMGARRASRARVLWAEGTLYIVHTASRIEKVETAEPTREATGVWRAQSESGLISFTRRGCPSCGYRLGRIPLEQILAD